MKRIKVFTNHFYPEDFKINQISQELSSVYKIDVITQIPNYPKGSFYKGYGYSKKRIDSCGSVSLKRLPVIPRGENPIMLFMNYISYFISSYLYAAFTRDQSDHVFIYITSPIFVSWSALKFAKRNNARTTLYLLDLWPDVLFSMLKIKNEFLKERFTKLCIKMYHSVDNIMVSSHSFKQVLIDYGIDKDKISYLPQHADKIKKRYPRMKNDKFTITFTGNIGEAQGLQVLVRCAKILKREYKNDVLFVIVGDGRYKDSLISLAKKENVEHYFSFEGRVKPEQVTQFLNKTDFAFVSLSKDKTLSKTLPAKVQTYLAHGVPIIASANGEIETIISNSRSGFCSPAEDAESLTKIISKARRTTIEEREILSKNGYDFANKNFSIDNTVNNIKKVMG